MKMYKQFRKDKSGNLHPLYVLSDQTIPIGVWLKAESGKRTESGKVVSKLGGLAYRPGWHLSEIPYAPHIGIKENGKIRWMHDSTVWALCEVDDTLDYTPIAHECGMKNGKFNSRNAYMRTMPEGGYYWYNTNPSSFGNWMIADKIRVEKVLTDAEVEEICWTQFGVHSMPHRRTA
jgi:hypothetical protein